MGAIHLVRHGQASFGTSDYDRLSELGHRQARITGQDMANRGIRPDVVLHGGLRRQRETAEGVVSGAGWDCPVEVDERWAEYDADSVLTAARGAGVVDEHGVPDPADSTDGAKQAFQRLLDAALTHWAGLEAFDDYRTATDAALAAAATRSGSGRTTVVVSSAGTISLAAAGILSDPGGVVGLWGRLQRVTVNTGITRVIRGRGGMTCVAVNEHQHLERAADPGDPRGLVTLR